MQIMYLAKSMEMFPHKSSSEAPALPPPKTQKISSDVALANAGSETAAEPSPEAGVTATTSVETAAEPSPEATTTSNSKETSSSQPSTADITMEASASDTSDDDVENYFGWAFLDCAPHPDLHLASGLVLVLSSANQLLHHGEYCSGQVIQAINANWILLYAYSSAASTIITFPIPGRNPVWGFNNRWHIWIDV